MLVVHVEVVGAEVNHLRHSVVVVHRLIGRVVARCGEVSLPPLVDLRRNTDVERDDGLLGQVVPGDVLCAFIEAGLTNEAGDLILGTRDAQFGRVAVGEGVTQLQVVDDFRAQHRVALLEDDQAREAEERVEVLVIRTVDATSVAERQSMLGRSCPGQTDVGKEIEVVPVYRAGHGRPVEYGEVAEGAGVFSAKTRRQTEDLALSCGRVWTKVTDVVDIARSYGLVVDEDVGPFTVHATLTSDHLKKAKGVVAHHTGVLTAQAKLTAEQRPLEVDRTGIDVDFAGRIEG